MKIKNIIITLLLCLSANLTFSQKEVCKLIDDFAKQIEKAETFEKVRLALEMQAEINFELSNYIEKVQAEVNDDLANKPSDKPTDPDVVDPRVTPPTDDKTSAAAQTIIDKIKPMTEAQINSSFNKTNANKGGYSLIGIATVLGLPTDGTKKVLASRIFGYMERLK